MRQLTKTFKALSDRNRLRILKMLEVKPLCVCEIRVVLNLANSTVSKHLSILREAEFILDQKEGKWVNYYLNETTGNTYVEILLPLLQQWLPNEKTVLADREKVQQVDRVQICGL
jgi:ArsR family transcriptional regulator